MEVKNSVGRIFEHFLEKLFHSLCFRWEPSVVGFLRSESRVEVNSV